MMKANQAQHKRNYRYAGRKEFVSVLLAMMLLLACGLLAGCAKPEEETPLPQTPIGTWIDTKALAEKDNKAHPVKYRIDGILRDQKAVAEEIKAYNQSGAGNMIEALESESLAYCIASYTVKFPKDFPQESFGITDVAIPFEVMSLTGAEIEVEGTIYEGIGTTWEIGSPPQGYDFYAGDAYQGKIVFIMVEGYGDYLLHEKEREGVPKSTVYIKGE